MNLSEVKTPRKASLLFAVVILAAGMTAEAHHSINATYNLEKEVKLEGILIQFLFRNPHSFVHIEAPDENGKMQRYAVEWNGAGALTAQGVKHDVLRVGDVLIITGNPSRIPEDHRVKMITVRRTRDGFQWGARPGEAVD